MTGWDWVSAALIAVIPLTAVWVIWDDLRRR